MLDSQSESDIAQYSSADVARLSVPRPLAELFLERFVNLDVTNRDRVWNFVERFRDLVPLRRPSLGMVPKLFSQVLEATRPILQELQPALRNAWKDPVPVMKEAGLMFLAGSYMAMSAQTVAAEKLGYIAIANRNRGGQGFADVPDKFVMVMLHALKHVHLLRYCANPDCKEPYFVAGRASQTFCSGPCAAPAQREAKRRWWDEHGAARRKKLPKNKGVTHAKTKKT